MNANARRVAITWLVVFHAVVLVSVTVIVWLPDAVTGSSQIFGIVAWVSILTEASFIPLSAWLAISSRRWRIVVLGIAAGAYCLLSVAAGSRELDLAVVGIVLTLLVSAYWVARTGVSIQLAPPLPPFTGVGSAMQFSLSAMLVLTGLVAICLATFSVVPQLLGINNPSEIQLCMWMIGTSTTVGWLGMWSTLGRSRWWWRLLSLPALGAIALIWLRFDTWWLGLCMGAQFLLTAGSFLLLRLCGYRLSWTIAKSPNPY